MGGVYSATPTPQGVPTAGWASSWSGQPWGTATPIALSGTPATQPVGAAGIWDGVKWRATDFNGVKWRGSGWDGVKWRGAVWQGVKWRSMNFDGVKWRGSGWSSAMWE
jgi:hypothetical protein